MNSDRSGFLGSTKPARAKTTEFLVIRVFWLTNEVMGFLPVVSGFLTCTPPKRP